MPSGLGVGAVIMRSLVVKVGCYRLGKLLPRWGLRV